MYNYINVKPDSDFEFFDTARKLSGERHFIERLQEEALHPAQQSGDGGETHHQ